MRSSAGSPAAPCAGVAAAVAHVRAGGLLAYPTETVFGLGADASSREAVARLRAWKGRGADQPLSVLVADASDLVALGQDAGSLAGRLAARFWPGPLTLIVPAPPGRFAPGIARADGAVGLRCSTDPTARRLARALADAGVGPITATSLNRSGEPPAADLAAAEALCAGPAAPILLPPVEAGRVSSTAPSTVVDCSGAFLAMVREGALDRVTLEEALGAATEKP